MGTRIGVRVGPVWISESTPGCGPGCLLVPLALVPLALITFGVVELARASAQHWEVAAIIGGMLLAIAAIVLWPSRKTTGEDEELGAGQ